MRYLEAPEEAQFNMGKHRLFLAGGISGCPDWQREMVSALVDVPDLTVMNPRRRDFGLTDALLQVNWEFVHLRMATMISFWFPCETLCPLVLYELGAWSMTQKPLFVGIHPDYQRREDVEIQTMLVRPKVQIVYSLTALVDNVKHFIKGA